VSLTDTESFQYDFNFLFLTLGIYTTEGEIKNIIIIIIKYIKIIIMIILLHESFVSDVNRNL